VSAAIPQPLGPGERTQIVQCLADAFRQDPAFLRLFRSTAPGRDLHYRRFMALWVDNSLREQHKLLGWLEDGRVAAVVGVAGLGSVSRVSWSIRSTLPAMLGVLPGMYIGVGLSMLRATAHPKNIPLEACELSMLAVPPEFRRRGLARDLLGAVQNLLAEHPAVAGIYLYTTAAGSLQFYQHLGFTLVASASAMGVPVYHLYRHRDLSKSELD